MPLIAAQTADVIAGYAAVVSTASAALAWLAWRRAPRPSLQIWKVIARTTDDDRVGITCYAANRSGFPITLINGAVWWWTGFEETGPGTHSSFLHTMVLAPAAAEVDYPVSVGPGSGVLLATAIPFDKRPSGGIELRLVASNGREFEKKVVITDEDWSVIKTGRPRWLDEARLARLWRRLRGYDF